MPPVSPAQAYATALVTAIGNAAIAFGVIDNTRAASIESAIVGLIALGFVIANALHHSANAKVAVAQLDSPPPGDVVSALRDIQATETASAAVQTTPGVLGAQVAAGLAPTAAPQKTTTAKGSAKGSKK